MYPVIMKFNHSPVLTVDISIAFNAFKNDIFPFYSTNS